MFFSRSLRAAVATATYLLIPAVCGQTSTSCNPLDSTSCSADTALGMTIDVDFTQGAVDSFSSSGGTPTYGSDGVTFTVAESGDAPQLNSLFYIMFGRVEITMKAAPGAGIVSSVVLESDDLDEIDMEWLGADSTEVQTNYFGKGEVTTYNRGQYNPAAGNQDKFITYIVDWTSERIIWYVGDTAVRTLTYADAETDQYPQTPMQLKFGAWSGGDSSNAAGTIDWARGPTNYSDGPFSMVVQKLSVTDYSTGESYYYSDQSGNWTSIKSNGGEINGNLGAAGTITATASASAATSGSPTVPVGGIGGTATSVGTIPSGWEIEPNGKIRPISHSADVRPPHPMLLVGPLLLGILVAFAGRWA